MREHTRLDRRTFLALAAASVPLTRLWAVEPGSMIVRQRNPDNFEFPFDKLDGFLTPTKLFYIRNHFTAPKLDVETWRLRVEGAVERPLALTLGQLKEMR